AESLQRLLDGVGESELASLERLRRIDIGQFLEITGSEVLQALGQWPSGGMMPRDPFGNLAKVEVTLVSESGEQAVVRMQWPEQESTEHVYIRVDGYWLPKSLADGWSSSFTEVRAQSLAWADELSEHPGAWDARLKEIDQLLDELAEATAPDDIKQCWQRG